MASRASIFNVPALRFPEFSGEWEKVLLSSACEINPKTGGSLDNQFLYIDLESVVKGSLVKRQIIEKDGAPSRAQRVLKENDILYQCVRPYQLNNYIFEGDTIQCVASTGYAQLRTTQFPLYIFQALHTKQFTNQVLERCTGTNYPAINSSDLGTVEVPICSFPEQVKIGSLLALIDSRIKIQSKIIEELKTLRSALRQRLLYQGSSDRIPLLCFAELKNGYAFKSNTYTEIGNHAIITISNVTGERYISTEGCNKIQYIPSDIQDHQILHYGDILISMTGNVGRVSMCAEGSYMLNQRVGLLKIKPEYIEFSEFIFQCLRDLSFTNAMKDKGQGAAQQNIGKSDIEGYEIPWFDDARYMKSVANLLLKFDNAVLVEEKQYVKYTVQKAWLLSKLFI